MPLFTFTFVKKSERKASHTIEKYSDEEMKELYASVNGAFKQLYLILPSHVADVIKSSFPENASRVQDALNAGFGKPITQEDLESLNLAFLQYDNDGSLLNPSELGKRLAEEVLLNRIRKACGIGAEDFRRTIMNAQEQLDKQKHFAAPPSTGSENKYFSEEILKSIMSTNAGSLFTLRRGSVVEAGGKAMTAMTQGFSSQAKAKVAERAEADVNLIKLLKVFGVLRDSDSKAEMKGATKKEGGIGGSNLLGRTFIEMPGSIFDGWPKDVFVKLLVVLQDKNVDLHDRVLEGDKAAVEQVKDLLFRDSTSFIVQMLEERGKSKAAVKFSDKDLVAMLGRAVDANMAKPQIAENPAERSSPPPIPKKMPPPPPPPRTGVKPPPVPRRPGESGMPPPPPVPPTRPKT